MLQNLSFLLFVPFILGISFQNWKEFRSYEGRFRVLIPGEMQRNERTIHTDIGEIKYVTHYYQNTESEVENNVYMVSYCDYPAHSIHSDSTDLIEEFFESTLESATKSISGELRYVDKMNYKDYPSRFWRIDYRSGTATIKTRAFLIKNRFYIVQAAMERGKSLNEAADKFMDSFAVFAE